MGRKNVDKVPPAALSVDLTEEEERLGYVASLLASRCLPIGLVQRVCRERYGIGQAAVNRLVEKVREGFRLDAERSRPTSRGEQIARLRSLLSKLHDTRYKVRDGKQVEVPLKPQTASRIIEVEKLIADLEGNREPIKVEHTVMRESVQVVLSNMSDEQFERLYQGAMQRKQIADAAVAVLPPHVIDVEVEG